MGYKKLIERSEYEANQHLEELWETNEKAPPSDPLQGLVHKYNGEGLTGTREPSINGLRMKRSVLWVQMLRL